MPSYYVSIIFLIIIKSNITHKHRIVNEVIVSVCTASVEL